jgi:hypothetical protein
MARRTTAALCLPLALIAGRAAAQPEWSDAFAGPASQVRAVVAWDEDDAGPSPWSLFVASPTSGPTQDELLVRWDGHLWTALGGGLREGSVSALAVFDDGDGESLYAAGTFKTAEGQPVGGIARWDGTAWSPLGLGLTQGGSFACLAVYDDDGDGPIAPALYAGGWFAYVDGKWCKYIARWDGQNWGPVGGGLSESVAALQVWDPDGPGPKRSLLVAAGAFREAGGQPAEHIAAWNGKAWAPLGGGVGGPVRVLAAYDDDGNGVDSLYAGGAFDLVGGAPAGGLAEWDEQAWTPVPFLEYDWWPDITGLAVFDSDAEGPLPAWLYVSGDFEPVEGGPPRNPAAWDGQAWHDTPPRPIWTSYLATIDADGPGEAPPSLFVGSPLCQLKPGADAIVPVERGVFGQFVHSLTVLDVDGSGAEGPSLVVGGRFFSAGATASKRIARWDGTAFLPFADGLGPSYQSNDQSTVGAMEMFDADGPGPEPAYLYAVGDFRGEGDPYGHSDDLLFRWDGAAWSVVADPDNRIDDMTVFDEDGDGPGTPVLFVGGTFGAIDGKTLAGIARWDGKTWSDVGGGVFEKHDHPYAGVGALLPFDPDGDGPLPVVLAVGGRFDTAGPVEARGVAAWDGQTWAALGDLDVDQEYGGDLNAMIAYDEDGPGGDPPALVIGGSFDTVDGVLTNDIAIRRGQTWGALDEGLGDGSTDWVAALAVYDDGDGPALYAGGDFDGPGDPAARDLARWRGGVWTAVGGGVGQWVHALAVYDDDGPGPVRPALYVGGDLMTAGGISSDHIARWGPPPAPCPPDCDQSGVLDLFDFLCFVNLFNAGDPGADCDGSGGLDLFDFLCFTNQFNQAC